MLSHSGPARSIRSSCNRCRSSKLKCIRSSESGPSTACQRCLRAKTECVFEQRAFNKNGSRRPRRLSSPLFKEPCQDALPRSGRHPLLSPPSSVAIHYTPNDQDASQLDDILMSTPGCVITPEASPTLDLFSVAPDPDSNYNANESGEDFRATSCRQSTDIQDAAWADDNLAYCEFAQYSPMAQTPLTLTDLNPWDHIDFSHTFLQDFDISTVLEKTPVPQAEEGKRNIPLQLELSVLLGEMQNNLQMLKAYYTSEDLSLEDALNNYPIGETLYLLRRFCDLQGHAWETDELLTWLQGTDSSDMVESLILVTCYVMMLRILDTLFDHLEKYLARITSATGPCNTSRGLKLRELTATTAMCARAREAFNTLKNALKSMNLPKRESHESIAVVSEIGEMFDCREIDTSEDRSAMRMVKENTVCSTIYSERDILCMKMMRLEQQLDHCCPADRRTLDV